MKLDNMIGRRFGRLVVVRRSERTNCGGTVWECICDCGNAKHIYANHLKSGATQSCGCLNRERTVQSKQTHGDAKTRLYRIWAGIKTRCYTPSNTSYARYGGRGIAMCDEWRDSFEAFRDWAMATGYDPNAKRGDCTIDRVNVNGNYEPSNCRWASVAEQNRNQRPRRKKHEASV